MFRPSKFRIPVGPRSFNGEDGLKGILWQRRLFLRGKGSSDADDENGKNSMNPAGNPGAGVGRGGGGGGTIRSAGGGLGKMAASQEESYFHNARQPGANEVLVQVLRMEMGCGPPPTLPSGGCSFGLGKLAVSQEDEYFDRKTMEDLEKLHDDMKNELESAGKTAEAERDRDKKVENKMKELASNLKDIIEEGKKK